MYNSSIVCANCSGIGHTSKQCPQPITSYGVILFRPKDPSWNQTERLVVEDDSRPAMEFLLIQRRDSIGFVEIMRGKYKVQDRAYIQHQLTGTTAAERQRLLTLPFDTLWLELWGPPQEGGHAYRSEREQARGKLEALRAHAEDGRPSLLEELLASAGGPAETPEWGFPKGRRELHEREYACAMREMWEETNISEKEILPVRGMEPIAETFLGSNGVTYCHKYFLACVPAGIGSTDMEVAARNNAHIRREVGALAWCSEEEALHHFRGGHAEKVELMRKVVRLLNTYYPLQLPRAAQRRG
jgi:8-oxo-dGTP pyrophosphatase MutT (NUDIX family)